MPWAIWKLFQGGWKACLPIKSNITSHIRSSGTYIGSPLCFATESLDEPHCNDFSCSPCILWTAAIVQRQHHPKIGAPGPISEQMKTDTLNLISLNFFPFLRALKLIFFSDTLGSHVGCGPSSLKKHLPLGRLRVILSCLLGIRGSLALSTHHLGAWRKYDITLSSTAHIFGHS